MNFDIVNIVTVIAVIGTLVFLIQAIRTTYAQHQKSAAQVEPKETMTDYEKILHATHSIEKAREKNQGNHFEDESVYLNRAAAIRESSSFFVWVNEK